MEYVRKLDLQEAAARGLIGFMVGLFVAGAIVQAMGGPDRFQQWSWAFSSEDAWR